MRLTSIPRIKSINLRQKRFERRRRLYALKSHWELFGGPLGGGMAMYAWNPEVQHSRLERLLRRRKQVGGSMNTHEFIKKQVDQQLQRDGFPSGICMVIADEALDYYKRKQTFPKGAFNECMVFARKRAKEMTGKKKSA
ncbi:hypothetical protein ACP0IR_26280 [Pseudomonas aeruginosa]